MMQTLLMLLKREYWEHKGSMVVLPLVIAGLLMVLILSLALLVTFGDEDIVISGNGDWSEHGREFRLHRFSEEDGNSRHEGIIFEGNKGIVKEIILEKLSDFADYPADYKRQKMQKVLSSVAAPLFLVMWGVIFFYLLGSLYDDRKDRSILFWKSMPVSDAMTVAAKLIMAMLVVPALVIVCIMVVQLFMLMVATFMTLGEGIGIWETFWAPAGLLTLWTSMVVKMLFLDFWVLPFFTWLVLVSASARSNPISWAIGIPVVIWILKALGFLGAGITQWLVDHGLVPLEFMVDPGASLSVLGEYVFSLGMFSALLVGGAMIAAAIYMRGRSEEL
ncbi:MAG: hypothetical protein OEZ23_05475 [Gammaproteobacteria bacterium]|nr:hypothetical protein [Gammaproteobacteria bacterium]